MPIRVTCACGKSMAVKDEFAGKAVRCPSCKQVTKVPASNGGTARPATSQAAPAPGQQAKPQPPKASTPAPTPFGDLDDLFAEEGMQAHAGPICPACAAPLKPGAVICTQCGTHLQTGQRLSGHVDNSKKASKFGHEQLDLAASTMKEEAAMQARTMNSGMPWWFLLMMLSFICFFGFSLVSIVNAATTDAADGTYAATLKGWAASNAVVYTLIIGGAVVQGVTRLIIVSMAFMESTYDGFLTLMVWWRFIGKLTDHPVLGLIYTMGFFTTLSGLGLAAADRWGA